MIIDLSLIRDIGLELPSTSTNDALPYTSLRDRPIASTPTVPQPPVQAKPSDTKRRKASEAFADDGNVPLPLNKFVSGRRLLREEESEVSSMFLDGRMSFPESKNTTAQTPAEAVIATPKNGDEPPAARKRVHSPSPPSPPQSSVTVPVAEIDPSSGLASASSALLRTAEIPTAVSELAIPTLSSASVISVPSLDPVLERESAGWEGNLFTPPPPPPTGATLRPLTASDPFAYAFEESLNGGPAPSYSVSRVSSSYTTPFSFPSTSGSSAASAYGGLPANSIAPSDDVSLFTASVPYVYVTFGAGMGQKDVDKYMAEHPIPAQSAMGTASAIPYYVPL